MYSTLALLFHEYGFNLTVELSLVIRHGPCSWTRPIMLELPGPPLNQRARGAVSASSRDAKNQNLGRNTQVSPYLNLGTGKRTRYFESKLDHRNRKLDRRQELSLTAN